MKKLMALLFALLILILAANVILVSSPNVVVKQGHMRLLAVTEAVDGYSGGIADLYLEIKPGSGRVFLETFPLTRVDTQVSTRFAKQIACDFADDGCDEFDFFYTITADSPILAGPSAGAAITILTFSLINDVELDNNVAITGTINSGGLIGPVGGLKAKIEAAENAWMKKVLIPFGESINDKNMSLGINKTTNESLDLAELRKRYRVDIIEAPTLDDALFEFTGKRFREKKANLSISQEYKDTMKMLAIQLCSRSTKLRDTATGLTMDNSMILDNAINLSMMGKDSFSESKYYSSASYCFGANVEFNYLVLLGLNLTNQGAMEKISALREEIENFDRIISNEDIRTITDLESYTIVKERLIEAGEVLDEVKESVDNNQANFRRLGYAEERINSAKSWSKFFENTGKEFDFNDRVVENACRTKLSEVEERLQYVQLYTSKGLKKTRKELDYAYQDMGKGDYELCLFKASKAKADVNSVLGVFGVKNENVESILEHKLSIVERNLVEQTEKGVFPVVGYSYFEYANSLKEDDPFSALLYSEYALELSNLDIYFESPDERYPRFRKVDEKLVVVLILGIILGFSICKVFGIKKVKKRRRRKKYSGEHK